MRKPLASFRNLLMIGAGVALILLVLSMTKYESLMHWAVTWISDLMSGH